MVGMQNDRDLTLGWSVPTRQSPAPQRQAPAATSDPLDVEMAAIKAARRSMDMRIINAARMLAARGEWTAVIRLLVLAGSHQQVDIAKATGVMRSTVTRWLNGDTQPQAEQIGNYLASLIRLLEAERDMNIFSSEDDLVIR